MRASRWPFLRVLALVVVLLAVVALFLNLRSTAGRTTSSRVSPRLDADLARLVPGDGAGCAAAVYENDGLTWTGTRGLADVAHRHPITDDTVFGIGRTTEQFTATAALLLADRGDLDLDAPLSRFLPTLPPWAHTVTVRNLLEHTSGIPNDPGLLSPAPGERVTPRMVLRAFGRTRPEFEAGTQFWSSDSDYVLLGLVVQAVDGRSLADFLAAEVFPGADVHAALDRTPAGANAALSYQVPIDQVPYREKGWGTVGDIGLHTTAKDLATWGAQYWHPTVGGRKLLMGRTADLIRTDAVGNAARVPAAAPGHPAYGPGFLAWTDDAGRIMLHAPGRDQDGFADDGFSSDLVVIPKEHLAAAVLCNHVQPDPHLPEVLAMDLLDDVSGKALLRPAPN